MDLGIAGRRAAVGAASTGLGYGAAEALVAEGVRVAICSRDEARIREAAERLGNGVVPIVADLSNTDGATGFVRDAERALGGVDILVANAGGPPPGSVDSTDLDAYRAALELSMLSTVALCRQAVPAMRERGWGRVVAITSSGVRQPIRFLAGSSAARAAVTSYLKILATEAAPDGVTVNSVQPGLHATDRIRALGNLEQAARSVPAGFVGDAGDFGKVVAFLCSEPARFITGTGVLVDGGACVGLL
ncbi:MAG: SDR family oxidoreductase [Deltaproteobacteria bacterium]|nr:SDR family oxidoreductase [Deltaproteobacteria bacterium]MBW2416047.1 SDR family oxidoreductase [Deltaproteobacteria bacterium]